MPGTVTVYCDMPNGMVLRLYDILPSHDTAVTIAVGRPEKVTLNGCGRLKGNLAASTEPGCGFTVVDADFFAEWRQANPDLCHLAWVYEEGT